MQLHKPVSGNVLCTIPKIYARKDATLTLERFFHPWEKWSKCSIRWNVCKFLGHRLRSKCQRYSYSSKETMWVRLHSNKTCFSNSCKWTTKTNQNGQGKLIPPLRLLQCRWTHHKANGNDPQSGVCPLLKYLPCASLWQCQTLKFIYMLWLLLECKSESECVCGTKYLPNAIHHSHNAAHISANWSWPTGLQNHLKNKSL